MTAQGLWLLAAAGGVGLIVWGAEAFAENLGRAAARLRVSGFALALLLAGAEPEELATSLVAALRGSPGIALGDVVGANAAICLVALGVGAWLAPLPFRRAVLRYALLAGALGAVGAWFAWDGMVGRTEGLVLVALYALYVGAVWWAERRPPAFGEAAELAEAGNSGEGSAQRSLLLLLAGLAAMAGGAALLVEAIQRIAGAEAGQLRLGLTLVGFATGFELVVLAWSAARRGMAEAVVASVCGSFAYNATMTLGASALARPLTLASTERLRAPLLLMVGAPLLAVLLGMRRQQLGRADAVILLAAYLGFIAASLLA